MCVMIRLFIAAVSGGPLVAAGAAIFLTDIFLETRKKGDVSRLVDPEVCPQSLIMVHG